MRAATRPLTLILAIAATCFCVGCRQEKPTNLIESDDPTTDSSPSTTGQRPINDPNVKTFAEAARAAGIREVFEGTGPFTIFAPTNAAFEKFGNSRLNQLLKPENHDKLVDLLIYHIVPGEYHLENLKSMNLKTINGKEIQVSVENGLIKVNNASVISGNKEGPNGVMHEIDAVLQPENK